jgi:hypothetical protein
VAMSSSSSPSSQPSRSSVRFDEALDDAFEIQKSARGHSRRKERMEKQVGKRTHNTDKNGVENDDTVLRKGGKRLTAMGIRDQEKAKTARHSLQVSVYTVVSEVRDGLDPSVPCGMTDYTLPLPGISLSRTLSSNYCSGHAKSLKGICGRINNVET